MLYPLWTAKPGSGCTTISLALAASLASRERPGRSVLLVDLDGDVAAAAAVPEVGEGLTDWLAAERVGPAALGRLEVDLSDRLAFLPVGSASAWTEERVHQLLSTLERDDRRIVVDVSTVSPGSSPMHLLRRRVASSTPSLLVTRPCYLAMRRAALLPIRPTGVVLVREPGRELSRFTVADMVGAPVVAQVDLDPAVARAVDHGHLLRRPPRAFVRQLARAVS